MSGCGKHDKHGKDCICETVRAIKEVQDSVERDDDCDNNCFDLLGHKKCRCRRRSRHDTIPFFLQNDQGIPFFTATVRERDPGVGCEVIVTPFFRVSKIKGCCAVLELLDTGLNFDIPDVTQMNPLAMFQVMQDEERCLSLRRTGKCITVDLSCFCAIQCLDPANVVRD